LDTNLLSRLHELHDNSNAIRNKGVYNLKKKISPQLQSETLLADVKAIDIGGVAQRGGTWWGTAPLLLYS